MINRLITKLKREMGQNNTSWTQNINWGKLYNRLLAFAEYKKRFRPWYRDGDVLPGGGAIADVVSEAIEDYLWENPPDASQSVTEQEVQKALKSKITNKLKDMSELLENRPQDQKPQYLKEDKVNFDYGAIIDINAFENEMIDTLDKDSELSELFFDLYISGEEPGEIMKNRGLSERDYHNRARRLRTRVEKVLINHEITRKHDTTSRKVESPLEST